MNTITDTGVACAHEVLEPRHISSPAPWSGHTPFALWLMPRWQPKVFVELGAYSGISYLSFCQSVAQAQLDTQCYAVDTWAGDAHAGYYDDRIYQQLKANHDDQYVGFSRLMRMTFDAALPSFADGSVDLLHIDGWHTYEAVKHDFETWLPKLSSRAIVLFHDTNVHRDDFGVARYWAELRQQYAGFEFPHSNGLGVLLVGANSEADWSQAGLPPIDSAELRAMVQHFIALGRSQERRVQVLELQLASRDQAHQVEHWRSASNQQHAWIEKQDEQLLALQQQLAQEKAGAKQRDHWIERQDEQLLALQRQLALEQAGAIQRDQWIQTLDEQIEQMTQQLAVVSDTNKALEDQLAKTHLALDHECEAGQTRHAWILKQDQDLLALRSVVGRAEQSPMRFALRQYRKQLLGAAWLRRSKGLARRGINAWGYVRRGEWQALVARTRIVWAERRLSLPSNDSASAAPRAVSVAVLTTPHTLFLAQALEAALERCDVRVEIMDSTRTLDAHVLEHFNWSIVIAPQVATYLPPGERRICFQVEQSVSDRWFGPEYLQTLESSLAVLDYSRRNLAYLSGKGIQYPHTFHVPMAARSDLLPDQVAARPAGTPRVLFYGDASAPRRARLLAALQAHVDVRVVTNTFGDEMRQAIVAADVVVNLHFYEDALLESARVFECLSLGARVVSETAVDLDEYPGLEQWVDFIPCGDEMALITAVSGALRDADQQTAERPGLRAYLRGVESNFQFMLYRFLLARGILDFNRFSALVPAQQGAAFALSMPETVARRQVFEALHFDHVRIFDGVRYTPGWLGCAMSYKYLCADALKRGVSRLMICEDDVELPPRVDIEIARIERYLTHANGHWDVFAGLIAHLDPAVKVLAVEDFEGQTFVTLDRMTSMVCNWYSVSGMAMLADWDETNHDVNSNTIDRYLETRPRLRVVTTLQPLFGHREELNSSLWGFNNTQYTDMIRDSHALLREKVQAFLAVTGL